MVMWSKLVQWYSALGLSLNCGGEAQKLSLLRLLGFVVWKAQTNRAHHIKWAREWSRAEPNDGETWVLMTMFVPLDPTVPEASISLWTLKLCEPINTLFCFKLLWVGFLLLKIESVLTSILSTNIDTWQIQVFIKLEVMATLKSSRWEDKMKQEVTMFKLLQKHKKYMVEKYRRKPKCLLVKDWLNNTWFSHIRKSTWLLKLIKYIYCVWTWKNGHDILRETVEKYIVWTHLKICVLWCIEKSTNGFLLIV